MLEATGRAVERLEIAMRIGAPFAGRTVLLCKFARVHLSLSKRCHENRSARGNGGGAVRRHENASALAHDV